MVHIVCRQGDDYLDYLMADHPLTKPFPNLSHVSFSHLGNSSVVGDDEHASRSKSAGYRITLKPGHPKVGKLSQASEHLPHGTVPM